MRAASTLQLALSSLLCISGILLLFLGFYRPPEGEISGSVLVAFGEVATFSGALLGIDYRYRYRYKNRE